MKLTPKRKESTGIRRAILLVAGIALLTLACGRAQTQDAALGEEQASAAVERFKQEAQQCEPGKEHWADPGPPIRGGTFSTSEGPPHLDPTVPGNQYKSPTGLYEWLVKIRMCYTSDTIAIPNLAKSWDVSPDGRTWTFKLHENVKWHNLPPVNGRAFTSADVAWTLDYISKGTAPQQRFYQDVTYSTPDPYTVVFKLKEPVVDFLLMQADDTNAVVPHEVKEQYGDFKRVAVGTGAFQLKDYKPDQSIVYQRNPNYYEMGADGKPLPYVDQITGVALLDRAATLAAIRSGQEDHNRGGFTPREGADLKAANPKAKVVPIPALTVYGLWFNTTVAPWNDVRVRRAVSFGFNRDDIIAGGMGGGGIWSGFMPAVLGEFAWPEAKVKEKFKYDPEQAKKLFAEAGFTGLATPIKAATGSSATYGAELEAVGHQLGLMGIRNELVISPGGATASGTVIRSFAFDISYGAPGTCKFPDCWMRELVGTGPGNITRMTDPKLDAMAAAQAKELDPVKRIKLILEEQDYLYELMPFVPMPTIVRQSWIACRMKNMRPHHGLNSIWPIQHAWIDERGC